MNSKNKLIAILSIALITILLGIWGIFPLLDPCKGGVSRFLEAFYLSLQLFTISYPDFLFYGTNNVQNFDKITIPLQLARLIAPLVTLTTLLSVLYTLIEQRLKIAWVFFNYEDHVIVYGFNTWSKSICENLQTLGYRQVIVVDPNLTQQDREWIRGNGYIDFKMSGTDSASPHHCKAAEAHYIFAANDDDSLNLKILARTYQRNCEAKDQGKTKQATECFVHFAEPSYRRLQFGGRFARLGDFCQVHFFSICDLTAKDLASDIYTGNVSHAKNSRGMNIALFGFDKMGQAVLEQLIQQSYFSQDIPIQITIFDQEDKSWNELRERFPILNPQSGFYSEGDAQRVSTLMEESSFPQIEFEKINFNNATLTSGKLLQQTIGSEKTAIALLCLEEATDNLALADTLQQQGRVAFKKTFLRSDNADSEIRSYLQDEIASKGLKDFPSQNEICQLKRLRDDAVECLAKSYHDKYLEYIPENKRNNLSQVQWEILDELYRESNRRVALHVKTKLSLLNLSNIDLGNARNLHYFAEQMQKLIGRSQNKDELETLAASEHNRWCAEKLLDNWTPTKGKRDEDRRQHQDLVPWNLDTQKHPHYAGYKILDGSDKEKDRQTIHGIPAHLRKTAKALEVHKTSQQIV